MTAKIADRHVEALERHVKAGHFETVEQALDAAMFQLELSLDFDDDWVAPLLAEADADIAAGRVSSWDEVRQAMTAAARGTAAKL
jgi:hypothetical protein